MRIDKFLFDKEYFSSRTKSLEAIKRGEVFVNGKAIDKPSYDISDDDVVEVKSDNPVYVSLGGYKLEKAIDVFTPPIADMVFIDVGASTGGFTDCLLQNGAKRVYCVDVGEKLLDEKIANDKRVIVRDRTNARYLTEGDFEERVDGIVVDCSFISLEYVLPPLPPLLKENGYILALIKPQFETGGKTKMKNGILKDDKERRKIIERIYDFVANFGLTFKDLQLVSTNENKNKEYIAYLTKGGSGITLDGIKEKI